MKAISHLPTGYRQIDSIDLQKDKKAALTVNALALLIGAAMILGANLFVPITSLFTGSDSLTVGLRFLVLGVSIFAYLFLHELVHGIVMKALGTTDRAEKTKLYTEVQEEIWKDTPWAFLVTEKLLYATSKKLTGMYVMPDANYFFEEIDLQ